MRKIIIYFHVLISLLLAPITSIALPIIIPEAQLKSVKTQHSTAYIASTNFTKNDIFKSPVVNLSQFLRQEQSVARLTNNSADSSQVAISLRGFGDNATANSLILVDGFALTNPSLLVPNFNSIPLTDIERIEIVQGSAGVLWGDQAVGGVINIITKHPNKFILNAILGVGSYNTNHENFLIADKKENGFFYKLFASLDKTDNYRKHNQMKGNNIAALIGKDYARGTLSLQMQFYDNLTYFPGGLSEEQFQQDARQATKFKDFSRLKTYVLQLLNKHELNNRWIVETRLNHHVTNGDGFINFNFDRKDSLTSINPRILGTIANNKLIAGYLSQVSYYRLINTKAQTEASAWQNDLYAQATFPINTKLDFILGARQAWQTNHIKPAQREANTVLNQVFVTEQGINFHPTEELTLFLRRDGNFSFPKANEETWLPNITHSLQAQVGVSYETGAKWRTEKYASAISLYRLELHDEIAFNPMQTVDQPFGSFSNLDKTLRHGISLAQKYFLTSKMLLDGQLNYVDARFASGPYSGNSIPAVPQMNANMGLSYAITENWAAQYQLLYTGNRYVSDDIANMRKKVPGYFLNDIALQYLLKLYTFNFEVQNLFDKKYVNYSYYDTFAKHNIYYPAPGRNYMFTVKVNI